MTKKRFFQRPGLFALLAVLLVIFGAPRVYTMVTGRWWVPWFPINEQTAWFAPSVQLALRDLAPVAVPGELSWTELAPGFEVAELPALVDGVEVDRIALSRIDPTRHRFEVRNDPSRDRTLDDWMDETGALLVINGSYFETNGAPSTPVVMNGTADGPPTYDATHGAFVSSADATEIRDLATENWSTALQDAENAMVSFPLLIGPGGESRAPRGTGWLANRSFVASDSAGWIVLGTTEDAFFTLEGLSDFLKRAPLDLELALNLDGGPVACQGVAVGDFDRRTYGKWEVKYDENGQAHLLPTRPWAREPLPIVLAVFPRTDAPS